MNLMKNLNSYVQKRMKPTPSTSWLRKIWSSSALPSMILIASLESEKRRPRTAPLSAHANLCLLKASGAYVIHMRLAGGTSPNPLASDFQSD